MQNILITESSGFIGLNIRYKLQSEYNVYSWSL